MKTMTAGKPLHKATGTKRETERVRNEMCRSGQQTPRTPIDRQFAEFERTFSVRWEW